MECFVWLCCLVTHFVWFGNLLSCKLVCGSWIVVRIHLGGRSSFYIQQVWRSPFWRTLLLFWRMWRMSISYCLWLLILEKVWCVNRFPFFLASYFFHRSSSVLMPYLCGLRVYWRRQGSVCCRHWLGMPIISQSNNAAMIFKFCKACWENASICYFSILLLAIKSLTCSVLFCKMH